MQQWRPQQKLLGRRQFTYCARFIFGKISDIISVSCLLAKRIFGGLSQTCGGDFVRPQMKWNVYVSTTFNNLIQYVTDNANALSGAKLETELTWLRSLCSRKEQWAACFTWKHRTYGIHSTQRAVAVHSAINHFCSTTNSILQITEKLEQMADEHSLKERMESITTTLLRGVIGQKPIAPPKLDRTALSLSSFPRVLLNAQAQLITQYDCVPSNNCNDVDLPNDEKYYLVVHANAGHILASNSQPGDKSECTMSGYIKSNGEVDHGITPSTGVIKSSSHRTSLKRCSCQYPMVMGLPCRHVLRVIFHLSGTVLQGIGAWEPYLVCYSMQFAK